MLNATNKLAKVNDIVIMNFLTSKTDLAMTSPLIFPVLV